MYKLTIIKKEKHLMKLKQCGHESNLKNNDPQN